MTTNSVQGKWDQAEEEEEEDALSLCDLPLTLISHDDQPSKEDSKPNETTHEEFDFRSLGGHFSKEQEMCVADEVFFQGQILPLRHSFSSEAGLLTTGFQRDGKQFNRFKSKSESLSEFLSNSSSRSSSVRSQNSSSTSTSTNSTTTATTIPIISKPKITRNQFHTHPSPKPQLKLSCPKQASFRKSSVWENFRLGVVPTPEIGLQDLKVRSSSSSANKNCVSRNSSSSSNNSVNKNETLTRPQSDKRNHIIKHLIGKGGGLLSGCDCSIETVESEMVMIKGGTKSTKKTESSTTHAMKEKVVESKKKLKQRQKQGKKVMSHRRTFEWLKELHASHPDEEALLSNPS